jgi:hypothetical protein
MKSGSAGYPVYEHEGKTRMKHKISVSTPYLEGERKMRTSMTLVIAFCLAFVLGHEVFAQGEGGLRLDTFQSQLTSGEDSSGHVRFTVTASAWNFSDYGQEFNVPVRGLDNNGKALISIYISGRVGAREAGTLQGQGSMPLQAYDSIVIWERVK